MEQKLEETTKKSIEKILNEGLTTNNLDYLYKLAKINHIAKEDKDMYNDYGRYGRTPGHGSYGEYGRRGYDMKYRGDESLDRMAGEYGRYQESKSRYGASEETDKSFHYMVKALEDFIMVLKEEADTPEQKQQLMQSLQNSMR